MLKVSRIAWQQHEEVCDRIREILGDRLDVGISVIAWPQLRGPPCSAGRRGRLGQLFATINARLRRGVRMRNAIVPSRSFSQWLPGASVLRATRTNMSNAAELAALETVASAQKEPMLSSWPTSSRRRIRSPQLLSRRHPSTTQAPVSAMADRSVSGCSFGGPYGGVSSRSSIMIGSFRSSACLVSSDRLFKSWCTLFVVGPLRRVLAHGNAPVGDTVFGEPGWVGCRNTRMGWNGTL